MPVNIDIVTGTLTVGTTAISGGTSGRVLYNNGGTLGEFGDTDNGALHLEGTGGFNSGVPDGAPTLLLLSGPSSIYHAVFTNDENALGLGYLWQTPTGLQFGGSADWTASYGYIDLSGTATTITVDNGPFNVVATGIDFNSSKFSVDANGLVTTGAAGGTTGALKLKGTTSGTVTLSVADAAGTWTMKLPTTGGTSGYFLQTNGAGVTTWAAAGGGLTVGTTTITSGTSGRILYNNSGVLGEATVTGTLGSVVLSTAPTLTGPVTLNEAVGSSGLTITGATQTTSQPALNITQTWNAAGVAFTGVKVNVTSTASAAASLVADLQVGSATVFSVSKIGDVTFSATAGGTYLQTMSTPAGNLLFKCGGNNSIYINASARGLCLSTANPITWVSSVDATNSTISIQLVRDADAVLALRNSTNAQTFRIYNTYTSSTNYELAGLFWSSNVFHIGADKGSGGGTARVLQIDYGGTTTAAISVPITSGDVTIGGAIKVTSATMIKTATSFTNGAAAATATMTNAPAAGNPTKWIPIDDNGTTRYIPAW